MGFVVTIDGPAGAGKSTVARRLARALRFRYLDTGALYRAVAWAASRRGLDADSPDAAALGALAGSLRLDQDPDGHTFVDGVDVSTFIRSDEVSQAASRISALPPVRAALVGIQREFGERHDLVCEGRDMGSVIFPDAPLKVYLLAEPKTRARRRQADLSARGEVRDLEQVVRSILERDARDAGRADAPLKRTPEMVEVDSTHMNVDQVVQHLLALVANCRGDQTPATGR